MEDDTGSIVGKILQTKDGRVVGNAFCFDEYDKNYRIETDFGNKLLLSDEEVCRLWWTVDSLEKTMTYKQWKAVRLEKVS